MINYCFHYAFLRPNKAAKTCMWKVIFAPRYLGAAAEVVKGHFFGTWVHDNVKLASNKGCTILKVR